jgi:type IX secretion system PorP/SprF family membrane protein
MALVLSGIIEAQDIHFSQINASPLLTNPALNGVSGGSLRVVSNNRLQWNSLGTNYRTFALSVDGKILDLNDSGSINVGGLFFTDKGGDLDYSTFTGSFALGVSQSLSNLSTNVISASFMTSYTNTTYDPMAIVAFDAEPLSNFNMLPNYFDFSLGVIWYAELSDDLSIYQGGAIYHINTPSISIVEDEVVDQGEKLFRRTVLNGGMILNGIRNFQVSPSYQYFSQGPHKEFLFGLQVKKKFNNHFVLPFGAGIYYRLDTNIQSKFRSDALIITGSVDLDPVTITLSYDFNVSKLSSASRGRGGPELSLIYVKDKGKKRALNCPIF